MDQAISETIHEAPESLMLPQTVMPLDSEHGTEDLPPFAPVQEPNFRWGEVEDGKQFFVP